MYEFHDVGEGLRARQYDSYKDYLRIQGSKLKKDRGFASRYSKGLRGSLAYRIATLDVLPGAGLVLCLGARLGGEVQAFLDSGFFAVGIDINPGKGNKHVLYGDFHDLQFPDNSFDMAYTNSLDHVLNMDTMIGEVGRVLKHGGLFMTENKGGVAESEFRSAKSDKYDCMEWQSLEHLITFITRRGFEVIHRYRGRGFTPWGIIYRKHEIDS